jgi:hypothetical protein
MRPRRRDAGQPPAGPGPVDGTTWIGYSYIDDWGDEVIYWFEYEMIYDGDTGAVEYVRSPERGCRKPPTFRAVRRAGRPRNSRGRSRSNAQARKPIGSA